MKLPDKFLLGVASASTQIEGGDVNSNWNDWFNKGHIKDGSDPANANQHWRLWKEDTDIMGELGLQICRFGVEWARIEPEEGCFDESVISRYRQEIEYMKSKGIRPLMTLHHFSNPMWFENKGAFTKRENLQLFLDFAKKCIDSFGDLVDDYITINEPNVYAMNGYFGCGWPPGENNFGMYCNVLENLAHCHIEIYKMIHEANSNAMVSFANHLRVFKPKTNSPWYKLCSAFAELGFQGAISRAMFCGKFSFPLHDRWHTVKGEYADFIGINYYSRSEISGLKDGVMAGTARNDLDWEIYPKGIEEVAQKMYKIIQRPIWITENGTCDNEDKFRARYIAEHLNVIAQSDLPFERYYHWCFLDNFEWIEGESARFGIVHVDYKTQERTIKDSARFYSEVIKSHGVTDELWNKYCAPQRYRIK